MLNQEQIKGKWTEIKGGVKNLWGKVTDDELEQIKGNLTEISGIVQKKYGESKESIKVKIDRLMSTFENDTDKNLKGGESSYERNPNSTKTSSSTDFQEKVKNTLRTGRKDYDSKEIFEEDKAKSDKGRFTPGKDISEDRNARH